MKKILSLFCALAVVLSASAVPFRTEKVASFSKTQKVEKKSEVKKAAAAKPILFAGKKKVEANQKLVAKPAVKNLKKATLGTYNVNIAAVTDRYYSSYGLYIYSLVGENDVYYSFAFPVDSAYDPVVAGVTYTLDDMDDYYSYWYDDNWNMADFTACTFTKTIDANNKVKIIASATDTNGDVWNLTYDEAAAPEMPAGGTFVADEIQGEYSSYYSDIQYVLSVSDAKLNFYFDILLAEGVKDVQSGQLYTTSDMDLQYTGGVFNKATGIEVDSASFIKTVGADGSYVINAFILDTLGNSWNISGYKAAPTVDSVTLTLNGTAVAGTSACQFQAADADTTKYVSLIVWGSSCEGTFTEEDLYAYGSYVMLVDGNDMAFYDVKEANFTVVYNEEAGKYFLNGTLNTANEDDDLDQVVFTLNLTLDGDAPVPPTPGTVEYVTFSMQDMTVTINDSYWDIKGTDPTTGYFLEIRSLAVDENIAGTYTEATLDDYWTYVGTGNSTYFDIATANIDVTLENGIFAVSGSMSFILASSSDTIIATVNVAGDYDGKQHLDYDEKNSDFIVNFPEVTLTDYIANYGIVVASASDDNNNVITLYFFVDTTATSLTPGVYAIDTTFAVGTVWAGEGLDDEGYITGSYAGIKGSQGITNIWWIVAGTVTVAENGIITVDATNTYDRLIKSVLGQEEQAIENTDAAVKATKRLVNGQLVIEKNGVQFNAIGTILK